MKINPAVLRWACWALLVFKKAQIRTISLIFASSRLFLTAFELFFFYIFSKCVAKTKIWLWSLHERCPKKPWLRSVSCPNKIELTIDRGRWLCTTVPKDPTSRHQCLPFLLQIPARLFGAVRETLVEKVFLQKFRLFVFLALPNNANKYTYSLTFSPRQWRELLARENAKFSEPSSKSKIGVLCTCE